MKVRSILVGAVCTVFLALVAGIVAFGRGPTSPSVHLGGGSAWFPTLSQGSMALLDGGTGSRVTRVDNVGKPGGDFTVEQSGSSALVVDRNEGTITKIDGATWAASQPVRLASGGDPQLRVVTAGDTAWVLSQNQTIVQQLDPRSMTMIGAPQTLPANASDLGVTPDGTLWVVSGSGEIRSFRDGTQATSASLGSGGRYGLALAGAHPVAVDLGSGLATEIDPGRGTPGDAITLDAPTTVPPLLGDSTEDAPWLLAVAPTAGTLVVSDLDAQQRQAIPLGPTADAPRYGAPVENRHLVFVPDDVSGSVIVIDPAAGGDKVKARVDLGLAGRNISLLVHDQHVWFNEVDGDRAGVITDGLTALAASKTEAGSAAGQAPKVSPAAPGANGGQAAGANGTSRAAPVAGPPSRGGSKLPSPAANGGATSAGGADGAGADLPSPAADGGAGGGADGGADGGGAGGSAGVDFTASPSVAQVGETVTFTDASPGSHTVTGWSAPDGTPVASTNGSNRFQSVFKAAGTFNVTLTVDAAGGAQSVTHQIKVDTQITLPDLHGLTFQQATKVLNDMGLALGNQIEIVTTTLASGRLVNTDPPAGTAVSRGAVINYRTSAAETYAEFAIPSAPSNSGYHGITVGPDGNVWFTEISANIVARVTPEGQVTEFKVPIANSQPWGITTGPDGNLWVALENASSVARITVSGNNAHFDAFPTRSVNSQPTGLALGRDGNLWVAEANANKVGVFDRNGLVLQEFPLQTPNSFPSDVVAGSDGFVYVGEVSGHKVAKFGTAGLVLEVTIPGANGLFIAPGPPGLVLWSNGTGEVGTLSFSPQGSPTTREFPTGRSVTSVALGPDGNVWYSAIGPDSLAAIDNFGRPLRSALADLTGKTPALVINGPGGMLWFIEAGAGRVGRVVI